MADTLGELVDLNKQATDLLSKYDNSFTKLDETAETKKAEIETLAQEKLDDIENGSKTAIGMVNDGGVIKDLDGNIMASFLIQRVESENIDASHDVDSEWVEIDTDLTLSLKLKSNSPRIKIGFFPNVEVDGTDQSRFFIKCDITKNGEDYGATNLQYLVATGGTGNEMSTGVIVWNVNIDGSIGDEFEFKFFTASETDGDTSLEFGQNFIGEVYCKSFVEEWINV